MPTPIGLRFQMRFLLLVAAFSTDALAEKAAPTTADRLIRYVLPPERFAEMMQQIGTQAMQGMQAQGTQLTESDQKRFRALLDEALPYEEMAAITARIYAVHFNERELDQLYAFYQTEIGTKLMREMPSIAGDSMGETTRIIQTRLPRLLAKYGFGPEPSSDDATAKPLEKPSKPNRAEPATQKQ